MMVEISEKILEYLETAGIDTRQIDYKELVDRAVGSLQRPAVNISINSGNFEKLTMTKRKLHLVVSLFLVVQNLNSEKLRRFDVYRLVESVCSALFLLSLGLDLQDRLIPTGFSNVTDNTFASAGYQLFKIDFSCSYIYEEAQEDLGMLRSIVNTYTNVVSTVLTAIVFGGTGATASIGNVFGGHANSEFNNTPIWCGNAQSTYNN